MQTRASAKGKGSIARIKFIDEQLFVYWMIPAYDQSGKQTVGVYNTTTEKEVWTRKLQLASDIHLFKGGNVLAFREWK